MIFIQSRALRVSIFSAALAMAAGSAFAQNTGANGTGGSPGAAGNRQAATENRSSDNDRDWGWIGLLGLGGLAGLMRRRDTSDGLRATATR